MMSFFILCNSVLKDGGEVHMILEEADFKSLNLKDLAASVNTFVKKEDDFYTIYVNGYTPRHIPIKYARIYIFELDKTMKVRI
ncbi:hypothetical protein Tco_0851314 [Tanacetum coccineum]